MDDLKFEHMGRIRHKGDTPVHFGRSKKTGEVVAIWFQHKFRKYNGYSMEEEIYQQIKDYRKNITTVVLVDYDGPIYVLGIGALDAPDKIILKEESHKDSFEDMMDLPPLADSMYSNNDLIVEENADTDNPQRLVTVRSINPPTYSIKEVPDEESIRNYLFDW